MANEVGRPNGYNFALCQEICERVSMGEHIKTVLDSSDRYPSFPCWCDWKRNNPELSNLYTNAIQDKAEMVLFEIELTTNDLRFGLIDAPIARIIIDTLKWKAAKFYPKMFGDKVDVTTGGEKLPETKQILTPEIIEKLIDKL